MNNQNRRELMVKVAKMYYIEKLNQQEIASRLFLSRSNISHILKKCVEQNIVEFYINETSSLGFELAEKLKKKYGLKHVIVVPSYQSDEETKEKLGSAVFSYLRPRLKSGMLLGTSWGTTVYHIAKAFRPISNISVDVIQIAGGISSRSYDTDGRIITEILSSSLNGKGMVPLVPYIVKSSELKEMLFMEPMIHDHFKHALTADFALIGLGIPKKNQSASHRAGFFTEKDMEYLEQEGAVLDVCGIEFDITGKRCAHQITNRIISLSYEDLLQIPQVIGAAVGIQKADAITAALSSGIISILATDEEAALAVLDRNDAQN